LFAIDIANNSFIDFVRFVSNSTNKNFIIDENIDKRISVILPHHFNNKDSFRVLQSVLKKNKMYLQHMGTTYYIKKIKKEKHFYSYKMVFLLPDKVIPIIKKYYPKVQLSKSKKTIIYQSFKKDSIQINKLISLLDSPTKSRKIRISLISYKDSDIKEFGMTLKAKLSNGPNNIEYKNFLNNLLSSSSLFMNYKNFNIAAYFTDLATKQLIDFKFSPILSLYDNKNTSFSITQNIPYLDGTQSINGSNDIKNNTYKYNDVGSVINVRHVSITDDSVYFNIDMKYEVVLDKSATPTTSKRYINNYLKIRNGESLLITGLKSSDVSKLHREIPILSSIPFIGRAFQWDSNERKNETFAIIISNIDNASEFALEGVPPLFAGEKRANEVSPLDTL
jgi:type II secretory pathway component GspD/PulD (secretin)